MKPVDAAVLAAVVVRILHASIAKLRHNSMPVYGPQRLTATS